ncbi:MAG: class I SAM-dependent methyltransferase [Vicinamibacterales bacterium]|nr:class I SAM-dependent methyltransferase [Vicinamibacterales bacterium]
MSGPSETESSRSLFGRSREDVASALPDREPVLCPLCRRPPQRFAIDFQGLHLARCRSCGLQFHSPRPVLEQMATAVYGAAYHRPEEAEVDARHERHYARQVARLERCLDVERRHLLDVGCGAGAFLRFVSERGWEVEGTDVVVTDWARASGARLWAGELPTIDFGTTRYDVVRFNHVLEHTRDPLVELRRAREVVSPSGILLVGVPNVAGLSLRLKSWQSRLGLKSKRWRHYAALHHLWFFTPATLQRLVEAAGFEVILVETPVMDRPDRSPALTGVYRGLLETCRAGSLLDLYARAR